MQIKCVPTIHPAAILREWSWRAPVVNDLRRAKREMGSREYKKPSWQFIIRPSFEQVSTWIDDLLFAASQGELWLDLDLETRAGHIGCCGLSWSRTEAISIPFTTLSSLEGYWSEDEETFIILQLRKLLTHPNVKVRGQNLLFDFQYIYRWWLFIPNFAQDTMISQHSAFCALPKSLDFLSSMYCDYYVQWKPDKSYWKGAS